MALEKFKVKGSPLKYKFLSSAIGAGFITLIVVVANLDYLSQTEDHSEKAQKVDNTKKVIELKGQLEHAKNVGINLVNQEYSQNSPFLRLLLANHLQLPQPNTLPLCISQGGI